MQKQIVHIFFTHLVLVSTATEPGLVKKLVSTHFLLVVSSLYIVVYWISNIMCVFNSLTQLLFLNT